MNRRGFLKGLSVLAVPVASLSRETASGITQVAKSKELTNLEKAEKIDKDFSSPFLYVKANKSINQGDAVVFDKEKYTVVPANKHSWRRQYIVGIATTAIPIDTYGFIQTVGHIANNG